MKASVLVRKSDSQWLGLGRITAVPRDNAGTVLESSGRQRRVFLLFHRRLQSPVL